LLRHRRDAEIAEVAQRIEFILRWPFKSKKSC